MGNKKVSSTKLQFIDLEMQCWGSGIPPTGQTNHIIQIGIVEINSEKLNITREASYFIRPNTKDFEISQYCTALTGITESKLIDEGRYFPNAINTIIKEFGPASKITYAWGSDSQCLSKQCQDYNIQNPWLNNILDYGIIHRNLYGINKKLPLSEVLENFKIPFIGAKHDALNDARALSALYIETCRRVRKLL